MGLENVYNEYKNIEKYTIHPVETTQGRLQFNENLWGGSSRCLDVLKDIGINDLSYYDVSERDFLVEALANIVGVDYEQIFLSTGSSEVLKSIFSVMLRKGDRVLIPNPGWGCYKGMIEAKLSKPIYYTICEGKQEFYFDIDDIINKAKAHNPQIIIITSPQMPTGNRIEENDLIRIIDNVADTVVVVDECYYGCSDMNLNVKRIINKYNNVIFVRSLSKIYGLANLRVGYGISNKKMVNLIDYVLPLHKLPNIIRKIAKAAIEDDEYVVRNRHQIIDARSYLTKELNKRPGITAYNSYANFVYVKINGYDVMRIHKYMEDNGMVTRLFLDKRNKDENLGYMRITVAPKKMIDDMLLLFDRACSMFRHKD